MLSEIWKKKTIIARTEVFHATPQSSASLRVGMYFRSWAPIFDLFVNLISFSDFRNYLMWLMGLGVSGLQARFSGNLLCRDREDYRLLLTLESRRIYQVLFVRFVIDPQKVSYRNWYIHKLCSQGVYFSHGSGLSFGRQDNLEKANLWIEIFQDIKFSFNNQIIYLSIN